MESKIVEHTLLPEYDKNSKVLILGTIPSPKSRENGFYYGHPQNRFWKVMAGIFNADLPVTNDEKKLFIKERNIALWDVLASCEIKSASDTSIRNPKANSISEITDKADIRAVFTTGKKAYELYKKYCMEFNDYPVIPLSSTSPANCRMTLEKLIEEYKVILKYLQ